MHYFKRISSDEIKLPEIIGAALLTQEEAEQGEEYIYYPVFNDGGSPYWYLRTPGEEDGSIVCMDGVIIDDVTDVDFFDDGGGWKFDLEYGCGNRPALYFSSSLSAVGVKPGDKLEIGGVSFTIITDTIALCDSYISVEIFDKETNDYEKSAIKKRVDSWFEHRIKPFIS